MATLNGAIAVVKVGGQVVGLMRNWRISDSIRRIAVKGLGSAVTKEAAVVSFDSTISCSFFEINYAKSGIPGAIRRDVGVGNALSQVATGNNAANFEDNLVLDAVGVQLDLYKKITDVILTNGLIQPKLEPYALVAGCFIESDNVNTDEGNVSGRDQTFMCTNPIVYNP